MSWFEPWGTEPWTLACIGDSLTNGTGGEATHRMELERAFRRLAPGRRTVHTVGSATSLYAGTAYGGPTHFEGAHDGTGGASTTSILSGIAAIIAGWSADPDIVLIMLGTNDSESDVATTYDTNYRAIVAAIRAAVPTATIVGVKPPPKRDATEDGYLVSMLGKLDDMLADGTLDLVADCYTDYPPTAYQTPSTNDHPDSTGSAWMAAQIVSTLTAIPGLEALS